jgi:hypothetical protein
MRLGWVKLARLKKKKIRMKTKVWLGELGQESNGLLLELAKLCSGVIVKQMTQM